MSAEQWDLVDKYYDDRFPFMLHNNVSNEQSVG